MMKTNLKINERQEPIERNIMYLRPIIFPRAITSMSPAGSAKNIQNIYDWNPALVRFQAMVFPFVPSLVKMGCTMWVGRLHVFKADMNRCGLYKTFAILFYRTFNLNRLLAWWTNVYHGWFHLHWLTRAAKNAKQAIITKWKILVHRGIRTHNPWPTKPSFYRLGHEIRYIGAFKTESGFTCAIYTYTYTTW